ncbi:carboxymuconolactone decarboxylase family protein [Gordonibacter sp.]|uniref:carboxymuconolactone decarboxylase family protein n=1 Tax=Gordonibacter sp. TaxID=1968902 RepID=UPI001F9B8D50|nr:carboxymuconolactone decarboxylase family protein [Gordonibacter sp.]HIW75371.1 carboxymuconolactone decarboxylase family protein [Candidatus Gordonibacter avicola]
MQPEPNFTDAAREFRGKLFPGYASPFIETDPEFIERFDNFVFGEVANADDAGGSDLDDRTRLMAILAAIIGCQGELAFQAMVPAALEVGVTPVELKEIIYQSMAYLGMGRALPFLRIANDVLTARGVKLPLPGQATTEATARRAAGNDIQVELFGEQMRESWERAPEETSHIDRWLAANCFGDWYTRTGLDLQQREMITLCFLAAQGGCEPQLKAHIGANLRIGNDRVFLIKIVSQLVPYLGYPRCLNALRCIEEAADC